MTAIANPEYDTDNNVQTVAQELTVERVGAELNAQLVMVDITIHRWTGRRGIENAQTMAVDSHGDTTAVDTKMTTKNQWKLDIHPLFKEIDKTATKILDIRRRYSIPSGVDGVDLVPITAYGQMMTEVIQVRDNRRKLVQELAEKWFDEVLPQIRTKLGDHYHQVHDTLYKKAHTFDHHQQKWVVDSARLLSAFDITWSPPRPIGHFDPDNLDVTALSHQEGERLIKETQEQYKLQLSNMYNGVFEGLFGELDTMLTQLTSPHKDQNGENQEPLLKQRKVGFNKPINELLDMLTKIERFSHFTPPEILSQIEGVKQSLAGIETKNPTDRADKIRGAIHGAIQPILNSLKAHNPARANRQVII